MIDLKKLKELAEATVLGPWSAWPKRLEEGSSWEIYSEHDASGELLTVWGCSEARSLALFIAAANPKVVLSLIEALMVAKQGCECPYELYGCKMSDCDECNRLDLIDKILGASDATNEAKPR